jgi:hypothetical protein
MIDAHDTYLQQTKEVSFDQLAAARIKKNILHIECEVVGTWT